MHNTTCLCTVDSAHCALWTVHSGGCSEAPAPGAPICQLAMDRGHWAAYHRHSNDGLGEGRRRQGLAGVDFACTPWTPCTPARAARLGDFQPSGFTLSTIVSCLYFVPVCGFPCYYLVAVFVYFSIFAYFCPLHEELCFLGYSCICSAVCLR